MVILITGANGLVGSALCREGIARGLHVAAVVRPGADLRLLPRECFVVYGDFTDRADAQRLVDEVQPEVIIHAAAVISTGAPDLDESLRVNVEGTRNLVEAARPHHLRRWLQVSSMSAHPANKSVYGATKYAADQLLRDSGLPVTFFRPSLVYAPQRRGIFHKLVGLVNRLPVFPLVGWGHEPMRPVHADDLATAFYNSLNKRSTTGKTYQLGGPEEWTYRDVIQAISAELGKKPLLLPTPLPICRLAAVVGEVALADPPLTTDNIEGLTHGQPIDILPAREDLTFAPRLFETGFRECIAQGLIERKAMAATPAVDAPDKTPKKPRRKK